MSIFGIDASSANQEKKTGVQWYAFNLIEAMKKQPLHDGERVVLYSPEPLKDKLGILPEDWTSKVLKWSLPGGWMQGRMSIEMLRNSPDALFVPAKGLPRISAKKTITTIHDLGFIRRPDLWDTSSRRKLVKDHKRSIKKSDLILTPSEFTKQEIMDVYKTPASKIKVIPLGVNTDLYKQIDEQKINEARQKFRLGQHYFLFIGRLEKKKNVTGLIRAFEQFKAGRGAGDPYELVIIGSNGYGFEEMKKYFDYSPAKDHIKTLGYVSGEDAVAIINGAKAYLIPSWYEGFGLTNLEAMACGTPVITSDIPPHREVCADAALYVPPNEPENLAKKMEAIVDDSSISDALRQKGLERVIKYSWDKTAKLTLEALRSVL